MKTLDADPTIERLSCHLEIGQMKGTRVIRSPTGNLPAVGEILSNGSYPIFLYHQVSCIREYMFDDSAMENFLKDGSGNEDLRRIVRRLRLVNTRNRLSHALIESLLRHQTDYLVCGDPVRLKPLTQARLAEALSSDPHCHDHIDPSRLSRIIRNLPVLFPGGRLRGLADLCPSPREICCHFVDRMIKKEKSLILEGSINGPLSDIEIARRVEETFEVRISRRTVALIRRTLGIPGKVGRAESGTYREATADFSPPLAFSPRTVRESAPAEPGVYEIRTFAPGTPEEVVYIGSAGNLRKRLSHHLYSSGGNPLLRKRISGGVRFRYRIFKEDWRTAERNIYRSFLNTFGKPPECNRASP